MYIFYIDPTVPGIPSEHEFLRMYSNHIGGARAYSDKMLSLGKASVCARFISIFQVLERHSYNTYRVNYIPITFLIVCIYVYISWCT